MDYNQTLNLPKTEFPMRAGLPKREPEFLARWEANNQSQLSGVEDEKKQILAEARNNAKAEYDKIVARANTDATKIKTDAKKASELESEKARLAVKQQIAELAMQTATKVVEKEVSAETDKMLYDEFLNESSDK